MSDEQNCGGCRHLSRISEAQKWGLCKCPIPSCYLPTRDIAKETDGTNCPTFEALESATVYEWVKIDDSEYRCVLDKHTLQIYLASRELWSLILFETATSKTIKMVIDIYKRHQAAQRAAESAYEALIQEEGAG